MSFDYSKLRGRIIEKFGSQQKFAAKLGLSERSLSLKMMNKTAWKQTEIKLCCELLDIPVKEIHLYFFTAIVQNF